MADLENTIKRIEEWINDPFPFDAEIDPELVHDALELLKERPHWISVKERLPKSMANKVIVYLEHEDYVSQIGYGHYEKYKGEEMWYNLETGEQFAKRGYKVTHWMKMPESPEGKVLILC